MCRTYKFRIQIFTLSGSEQTLELTFQGDFLFAVFLAWWDKLLCISEVLCMINEIIAETHSQTLSFVTCWVGFTSLSREKPSFLNSFFQKLAGKIEMFHFWKAEMNYCSVSKFIAFSLEPHWVFLISWNHHSNHCWHHCKHYLTPGLLPVWLSAHFQMKETQWSKLVSHQYLGCHLMLSAFNVWNKKYTLALHIGNLVVIIIVKTIIPKPSNLSQVA